MHQWVVYDTVAIKLSKKAPSRVKSREEMALCPGCATPLCRGNKFLNIGKPVSNKCDKCGMKSQPLYDDMYHEWYGKLNDELLDSVDLLHVFLESHYDDKYWSLEYFRRGMTPEQVVNAIDFDTEEFDYLFT